MEDIGYWSPADWAAFDRMSPMVKHMATAGGFPFHPHGLWRMSSDKERVAAIMKCWNAFGWPVVTVSSARRTSPASRRVADARARQALRLMT